MRQPTTPDEISEFRAAIFAAPPTEAWIETRVRSIMIHYYQPDERPEVLAMAMERWKAIIGEISGPLAAWAFDEWERTRTHRPPPAGIVELANKRRSALAAAVPRPPQEPLPEETPEGREAIAAAFAALREGLDFDTALKAMDEGPLGWFLRITSLVCDVPVKHMRGHRRLSQMTQARALFCYAAKKHTGKTYQEIGRALGGRDHSTIIAAVDKATRMIEADDTWAALYGEIETALARGKDGA